ncbi:hypothetical protein [Halococcus sp. PRR34]|uniref:hypothetical protein n=1 Tax=Halococcus sp. PRR34 TaxID=3020830 RepID=UPI0023604D72|nr:hypothetical protein [Halococcus sp. PRR34]
MRDTAYDLHLGDYALVKLRDDEEISGEVTAIEGETIIISKYDPDGEIVAELTTEAENCRLHPKGRKHDNSNNDKLNLKSVSLGNDTSKKAVSSFIGVATLGNAIVLLLVFGSGIAAFLFPANTYRWVAALVIVGVICVMVWQVWTTRKLLIAS